jgi:cyclopropane fatty-acyl-phospholipid synthase-like methyltransferase
VRIITDHPVAYESPDHTTPRGTINDNSFNRVFNDKLVAAMGGAIRVLDLGCSGGGFVRSLRDQGIDAYGIEGSDRSRRIKRAEWATIPERLFTADVTRPFRLVGNGDDSEPQCFDVITAWEVLEHIAEPDLAGVFANIRQHLSVSGRLIVSISPNDDFFDGVNLHQTVRPFEWWVAKIHSFGWSHMPRMLQWFSPDWVRGRMGYRIDGTGEVHIDSDAWNSFHLVLERST